MFLLNPLFISLTNFEVGYLKKQAQKKKFNFWSKYHVQKLKGSFQIKKLLGNYKEYPYLLDLRFRKYYLHVKESNSCTFLGK